MKYEYKVVLKVNDNLYEELGIRTYDEVNNDFVYNENPVDFGFANELGEDGFEMFQVVANHPFSIHYFRKRIG